MVAHKEKEVIPIFIITCDRLEMLKKSMQSYYDCIKTPFEIVIRDQDSTFKPAVEFLKNLESKGTKIYWAGRAAHRDDLKKLDENIQDYFKTHPKSDYAVTNDDVALDKAEGDVLEVYAYLLKLFPYAYAVGPMLRIDDIPDHYPFKKGVLKGAFHSVDAAYAKAATSTIKFKNKEIEFVPHALIDATFGVSRKGTHWQKCREGIRVCAPYSARHLDWYVDPKNLTEDQKYYLEHSVKGITHWSSWWK